MASASAGFQFGIMISLSMAQIKRLPVGGGFYALDAIFEKLANLSSALVYKVDNFGC
jgi:hypothetical protein